MEKISEKDRHVLRELANKQLEYANSPRNLENIRLWYLNNACRGERPMVHIELWTFQHEVIPKRLRCEGNAARDIEARLYSNFLNFKVFEDDKPVTPYFPIGIHAHVNAFGLDVEIKNADDSFAYQHLYPITDLEKDFHILGEGQISCNREEARVYSDFVSDIFGDILPAKEVMGCIGVSPTQRIVALMSMEKMFMAMYDYPELFHQMMDRYVSEIMKLFAFMEDEGILLHSTGAEGLAQGSFCFTDELPGSVSKVSDLWGYMDSQETVGLSPEMFGEFIFPYYERIARRFGLLSYGCCEPIHPYWQYLEKLTNMRKVSISPWCDEEFVGEVLRGKKIVYHRKPAPHFIGADELLDEEAVRANIRRTMKAAAGNTLEIAQRDVYTIHNNEAKVRRYVQLIKETLQE